jgi:hypothetical protein
MSSKLMVKSRRRRRQTEHKQVRVRCNGQSGNIDEELAPLIRALWKAGIYTTNSCQENQPGIAWIEFSSFDDAKKFLDLVAVYPAGWDRRSKNGGKSVSKVPFWKTLYGRITNCGDGGDWQFDVHPFDFGVEEKLVKDEIITRCIGPAYFEMYVSIRFPKSDVPLILEQLTLKDRAKAS